MSTEGVSAPAGVEPLRPEDPRSVGGFRLVGRLGAGGMGVVYLGEGPDGRRVAVKLVLRELAADPDFRSRFRSEVTAARSVAPFCTARVLEHGEADGRPYLITEYIPGPSLSEYVEEHGPMPPEALRAMAVGIATALAAIHTARLVHRDLKPSNVLLSATGPRVIDFGIARAVDSASRHTRTGHVIGSPGWLAPEQIFEGKFGSASDVFAWGSLVAYAAAGRHPYGKGNLMVLAVRAQQAEHDLTGVPDDLLPLVIRALDPDPANRPSIELLLISLVGEEDPLTGAQNALSQGWTPQVLPGELFAPPPPSPPAPVFQPRAWAATPPPFPTQPPPIMVRPGPPRRRPGGSGVIIGVAAAAVVGLVVVAVFVAVRFADTPEGGGSQNTARTPSTLAELPNLCKVAQPVLPARVKGLKESTGNTAGDRQDCLWHRFGARASDSFELKAERHQEASQARYAYKVAWGLPRDGYYTGREKVGKLGDDAFAKKANVPLLNGPAGAKTTYWSGGVKLTVRHRNVVLEVSWQGADYSGGRSRVMKGTPLAYSQAKSDAVKIAETVIRKLG